MTAVFTLSVQCRLASSHVLEGCPPCDRLHGHTWTVRAFWDFAGLDQHGMGANFRELKDVLRREVHDRFDHCHLNDIAPFDRVPPTAENLAREVFALLREKYRPGTSGRLARVEVWEGPDACAAYAE
ncbi:MAG TPA: 6-carboxytetrahydropterin synthase [Candidatus Krumholzibacteria bacterium]|nr:6-carboxytetrahydropterin synthase [Candidatus Krumholzibacteria bacterium]